LNSTVISIFSGQVFKYIFSSSLARIISFFSVLVFSSLLSSNDFGASVVFLSCLSVSATFINFGVSQMIVREKSFLSNAEYSSLISASFSLSFLLLIFMLAVFFVLGFFDFSFPISKQYFLYAIIFSFFLAVIDFSSKIFVTFKDSLFYGYNEIAKCSIGVLAALSLMFFLNDKDFFYRILGHIIGLFISLAISLVLLKKYISYVKPGIKIFSHVFFHGCKIFPQIISNWVKLGADKLILASVLSLSEVGTYSFSFAICSVVLILGVSLNNAFTPVSMDFYRSGQLTKLKVKRRKYVLVSFSFSIFFLLLLLFLKQYFWPEKYNIDSISLFFLISSFFFQTVYLFYAKYFLFKLKIMRLASVNLLVSIAYISIIFYFPDVMSVFVATALLAIYSFFITFWVFCYAVVGERSITA